MRVSVTFPSHVVKCVVICIAKFPNVIFTVYVTIVSVMTIMWEDFKEHFLNSRE